jgi:hypothetical protein
MVRSSKSSNYCYLVLSHPSKNFDHASETYKEFHRLEVIMAPKEYIAKRKHKNQNSKSQIV